MKAILRAILFNYASFYFKLQLRPREKCEVNKFNRLRASVDSNYA